MARGGHRATKSVIRLIQINDELVLAGYNRIRLQTRLFCAEMAASPRHDHDPKILAFGLACPGPCARKGEPGGHLPATSLVSFRTRNILIDKRPFISYSL